MTTTINSTLANHKDRHRKLEKLLADIDYALLGEETEMLYQYKALRKRTIEEMKREWALICRLEAVNGTI